MKENFIERKKEAKFNGELIDTEKRKKKNERMISSCIYRTLEGRKEGKKLGAYVED